MTIHKIIYLENRPFTIAIYDTTVLTGRCYLFFYFNIDRTDV